MTITPDKLNGISILRLEGDLTHDSDLVSAVTPLMDEKGTRIVLDLTGVEMINSAGLGKLVHLTAEVNSQGGCLRLASPSPFVSGVFEVTQLNRFLKIHPTLDAAIEAMGGNSE
ncbi:MAG: STAS domain-containing protein [Phycisphaerae bacterium]